MRGFLAAISLIAIASSAFAADPAPNLTIAPATAESTAAAAAAPAEPGAEPAVEKVRPPRKKNFRRSRLTRDESEGMADRRRILLSTGEDRAIDLDFQPVDGGANGVAIGNPQVVVTTLVKTGDKRQLVFKPLKAGSTTVTIRDNEGTIRLIFDVQVTGSNLLRVANEIRSLIRDIEGLEIRIVGPKVVVEGEVLVPADYGRLLTVIQDAAYSGFVLNLATLSPLAMQVLANRIQEDVQSFAPNVKTRVVNGIIFLEGTVDSKDQADRAAKTALLYLPQLTPGSQLEKDPTVQRLGAQRALIQNFIVINAPAPKKQEKLVRVTFNFVELSKDYNKVFGFKWQPGFTTGSDRINIGTGTDGSTSATGPTFSGIISQLFPKLQSAQNAGYARILKTGTVIVRSGQPAKLDETTSIPFSVQGPNNQLAASSAEVGLVMAVTPVILGQSEDIQMELDLSQKSAVGRLTAGTAPITANHKVTTRIYVKSNESAAVAGVTSSDVGTDFNKDDPKAGGFADNSTDALFTLLRSKAYRKKKSQFVIFVTPQIIENASEGTEDLKKNFRIRVK